MFINSLFLVLHSYGRVNVVCDYNIHAVHSGHVTLTGLFYQSESDMYTFVQAIDMDDTNMLT